MTVTQDAYSRKYCPASTAEWTELLSGLGLNAPSSFWLCQDASGNLADSGSAARTCTVAGSPAYQQDAPGWQRKGIRPTDGSLTQTGSVTIPSVGTTSSMLLQMFALNGTASSTRDLNHIGISTAENARILAGNKLRAASSVNTSDGEQQNAGVLVVVTKFDRASGVLGVYTQHEVIKPTYSAPAASTTMYLFGGGNGASDATLVYAALWTGTDAEISDENVNALLGALHGAESTRDKMSAGSFAHKYVVSIEGCPYLLSDAPSAAVLNAYAGRDWTQVLGGLFVEMENSQSITPLEPFTTTGRCTIRVVDVDHSDTFGRFVARRAGGDETTITQTIDGNDTTVNVRSTQGFDSSGEIYIGTECIGYTGVTSTAFTGCTRGKYSPFGTALTGSGGIRFGNHHRVGTDSNQVQTSPVASSIPRVWLGKRVAVRLHTWDAANQAINGRAEAQLVFAGQISGISDDHNTGETVIELDHMMLSLKDAVLWQDPLVGEATPGLALVSGRKFQFSERTTGFPAANDLTVVSGTPASTNEIQQGTYSLSELTEALNRWLGAEKRAGRINGQYSFRSPVSNNDGIRTVCNWYNDHASDTWVMWWLTMPSEVAGFLGITDATPTQGGTSVRWESHMGRDAQQERTPSKAAPYTSLIFRPMGGGRLGQEFGGAPFIDLDNVTGTFVDQYAKLPASIKSACDPTAQWGCWLFDEKLLVVGTYDSSTQRLRNLWLAPFQFPGNNDDAPSTHFGRRADEPDAGPIRIRQVLLLEGQFSELLLELMYSTGASGMNHATYDTLGPGIGVGQPGELFGSEFERSLWNLPNASQPLVLVMDEPTRLVDLIGPDLNFRLAFMRWKDGNFEISQWRTPLNADAAATLSESNKSAPAGERANHRVASQETNEHVRPVIKVDYCRDFAVGRNGDYLRSFTFQDQTSVGDLGAGARPATIKLRNTFQQFANTGTSVEAGMPDFMARMPSISRSSREISRSLDHRYVEILAPGDIVTLEDSFARDPLTGMRGVNSRAAFVTSVSYDLGGPQTTPGSEPRPYSGNIECNFLDTQRGRGYAPTADIDETASAGGFSAGYSSGTLTLRCHERNYGYSIAFRTKRGVTYFREPADATYFKAGDKILIVERDPVDPASPLYWERTVASQSGNDIVLTAALSAPAWDATKRYRIVPQKYSQVQSSQRDVVFQADNVDEWVEDIEIPWHFSATNEKYDYVENTFSPGEFVPQMSWGDGRPWDVGTDAAIARTADALIDYKTAHQAPALWTTVMGSVFAGTAPYWVTMFFGPMFVGFDHPSATVTRSLTVAPFFRSNSAGNTAKVRITIMETPPTMSIDPGFLPGECFKDSIINGRYSRSAEWTTTSTTWQTGSDQTLSLSAKELLMGFVWVLVEGTGYIECRGLAKCHEGPRSIP